MQGSKAAQAQDEMGRFVDEYSGLVRILSLWLPLVFWTLEAHKWHKWHDMACRRRSYAADKTEQSGELEWRRNKAKHQR